VAINLSLNKLPWYAQVGVFVALSAAAVGSFWYFYADKTMADIAVRETQLATINQQIERGLNTAKRWPEFRREVESLEAQLDRLRAVLPEEQDVSDLLRRVQAMATESRLTIRGFTPRSVTRRQMHAEWPIGLQLEGTYHDLGTFLERVSKFPRIINVGTIHIKAPDVQSGTATITADCTATTFVLLDAQPAAAAPAPGAAVTEQRRDSRSSVHPVDRSARDWNSAGPGSTSSGAGGSCNCSSVDTASACRGASGPACCQGNGRRSEGRCRRGAGIYVQPGRTSRSIRQLAAPRCGFIANEASRRLVRTGNR